jgi:large subunit ribosomal protein L14e
MMNEIGRLCIKTAGRDSNKKCVIVDVLDNNTVLIDGETRRRKCNIRHLEPLQKVIKLNKGASHADVKNAFAELGIELHDTKPKKAGERPRQVKQKKNSEAKEVKPKKEKKAKTEKVAKLKKEDSEKKPAKVKKAKTEEKVEKVENTEKVSEE